MEQTRKRKKKKNVQKKMIKLCCKYGILYKHTKKIKLLKYYLTEVVSWDIYIYTTLLCKQ